MRVDTPCFESFCKNMEEVYGEAIEYNHYYKDANGFITGWVFEVLENAAKIHEHSWNDAYKVYYLSL